MSRLSSRSCRGSRGLLAVVVALGVAGFAANCTPDSTDAFDPESPWEGPGEMVGDGDPVTTGEFPGGDDALPEARDVAPPEDGAPPDCGAECRNFCQSQDFENPVHQGLCPSLWGVGLRSSEVDRSQACRRVYADMVGRYPTRAEMVDCKRRPWNETVSKLIGSDDFVLVNQRRWADKLLYDNTSVSLTRIFDADRLVGKLYRGLVPYDQFAAVVSAHPVLTRRYADAGDRAEAAFVLFMGRPPFENERSDFARLYTLWDNGYYNDPKLGERLPDAFIEYDCVTEEGEIDEESKGKCTSVLWGYNELILKPDLRAVEEDDSRRMWSGQLRPDEWEKLQKPGRILSEQRLFWEHAVDSVLEQYLDYDLGGQVPRVRDELVEYFLEHEADMRSLHYAVATSIAYRQAADGDPPTSHRWTWGPLKQAHAETWIDSIEQSTGYELSACDHRLPAPGQLEDSDRVAALSLLKESRWQLDAEGDVRTDYRDLARSLGGCPRNDVGGRFRTISILTTSKQLNFVNEVCSPSRKVDGGVDAERLLPDGVEKDREVTPELATKIVKYQTRKFFGRNPTKEALGKAREHGAECQNQVCTAEEFARPACFALLSSSEMIFY